MFDLNLKDQVVRFLATHEDPVQLKTILKGLGMAPDDRQYMKQFLRELVRDGIVVKSDNTYWLPDGKQHALRIKRKKTKEKDQLVGRLSITAKGFGFVESADGRDWLIHKENLGKAMHGDRVRASKLSEERGGRIIGEVVEVEAFGLNYLLGIFEKSNGGIQFHPFGSREVERSELGRIPLDLPDGGVGKFVRKEKGGFEFVELLGHISDPKVDEWIVLAENGLQSEFPDDVLQDAAQYGANFSFELGARRDFRDQLVFTIDGADARDFDDALHFRHLDDGLIECGIHIADVSEFVHEGAPMDVCAADRGNSVYLPHRAIPMLPEILSTDLCSLRPDLDRYTLSVVARLDQKGRMLDYQLCKGLIRSRFRLTYDLVQQMGIDRNPELCTQYQEVLPSIDLALMLSKHMKANRNEAGGLDLDMTEIRVRLDENQLFAGVVERRQNEANRLIEAFMCLANECVASFFSEKGVSIPYRIHDQPSEDKLRTLSVFLEPFGYSVPDDLYEDPGRALNELIEQLESAANAQVLQTQVLRSLKLAEYNVDNRGHFGLGSSDYAHFTSPIRRYADLLIHRRLSRLLREPTLGPEDFEDARLVEICSHISKKERDAARAESTFIQLKLLRHMRNEVGNTFEGLITEIKPFGMFVQLKDLFVTGMISLDGLHDDYYEFNPESLCMVGQNSGRVFRVGGAVRVQVMRVDFLARKIDLRLEKNLDEGKRKANPRLKGAKSAAEHRPERGKAHRDERTAGSRPGDSRSGSKSPKKVHKAIPAPPGMKKRKKR